MKGIFAISIMAFFIIFSSCDKSIEEKRTDIEENKLKNAANRREIKADSLKNEAEKLKDQAKRLEEEADELRDSARKI